MPDISRKLASFGLLVVLAACGGGAKTGSHEAAAGPGESPDQTAARIGERVITLGEVDAKARAANMQPYQALYDARRQALDALIAETLMDAEAKSRGIAREALIQQEVTAKVVNPTDEQIENVYKQNANAMGGRSLEEMKPQIQNYLATQSRNRAIQKFLDDLRKKAAVEVTLDAPRVAVTIAENDPARGPAGAPVQIVEFSDFQ